MEIRFVKPGINGESIGYDEHKPVFCQGVFPYETAIVTITEDHDRYAKAELKKILHYSEHRILSICRVDRRCQACPLIRLDYKEQCRIKKQLLEEALWKYGKVSTRLIRDMHESPLTSGYRNQLKLPVQEEKGTVKTGMYAPGSNFFIDTAGCPMHDPALEAMRARVIELVNKHHIPAYSQKNQKGLRNLILRGFDGMFSVCFITGKDKLQDSFLDEVAALQGMHSVAQSINTDRKAIGFFGSPVKILRGEPYLTMQINGIELQLSPDSFFQLNKPQAENLYRLAVEKIDPCECLVEAYCGIGTMSLLAYDKAKTITGVESIQAAVDNANANAVRNHMDDHARFICADAAEGLQKVLVRRNVDILLADPPRSGMDEKMIQTILSSHIRKIVYVSCNPATLGRNIKSLKEAYDVRTVIPFDLFPNTPHIESITVLERRGMKSPRPERKKKKQ